MEVGADGETHTAQVTGARAAAAACADGANQEWSIDFASNVTAGRQRILVLSVIDSFTKQSLALEVDTSFTSRRRTHVLDRATGKYGKPQAIRRDNGPELTSHHFLAWAIENKIATSHICPG